MVVGHGKFAFMVPFSEIKPSQTVPTKLKSPSFDDTMTRTHPSLSKSLSHTCAMRLGLGMEARFQPPWGHEITENKN